ncbi:MAG: HNH endonuclease [Acidobacteria bacterium]|nr:HNH endonuclease [Acidobacteriota bacterium]
MKIKHSRRSPKSSPPNAMRLWADIEDHLTPAFALSSSDRAVYFYLVRRGRLQGQRVLRIAARALAIGTRLSRSTVRLVLRRLGGKRLLRIRKRSYQGYQIEVMLPREIPGCVVPRAHDGKNLETVDFFQTPKYRRAIFTRERRRCFYCLRRLPRGLGVLDHVVPRVRFGRNSYRNLVASCVDCNTRKGRRSTAPSANSTARKSSPRANSAGGASLSVN